MLKKNDVIIQPAEEKHLPFLVKWGNANGLHQQKLTKRRTNLAEQVKHLQATSLDDTSQLMVVLLKSTDQPVGVCELLNIDWMNRTCLLNLHLEDKANVVGVHGYTVLQLVLEYAFKRLGLYKISIDILLEDSISTALFKQLGFKIEVRKRKHAFIGGEYKTVLEMSLLKHEFEQ